MRRVWIEVQLWWTAELLGWALGALPKRGATNLAETALAISGAAQQLLRAEVEPLPSPDGGKG